MGEQQNAKMDELFGKLKALGEKAKQARASFGQPLADRLLERVTKISAKLPPGNNGHAPQEAQREPQQEAKISCPKCGTHTVQGSNFCVSCGFDYSEESRKQMRQQIERESLERSAKMGVISGG